MKFDELRSIAHNIADSLASGVGLPIGCHGTDVFGEARKSPEGFITVDFLTGTSSGGRPSQQLAGAITKYKGAFAALCKKHGTSASVFRELRVRYWRDRWGPRYLVSVSAVNGRCCNDEYAGFPAKRIKVLDQLGRVRTKR
jgi:hypothetical protein